MKPIDTALLGVITHNYVVEMHSMNDYYGPGMETYRVPGFLSILRLYIIVSYFRITVAGKLQIQVI